MYAEVKIGNKSYTIDLASPIDISIPLSNTTSPIAFGAHPFSATPYRSGDFIGSLKEGSPVNFYDLHINPHGNGTHTETVLHIDSRGSSINKTLKTSHFICRLISIEPRRKENGDKVIDNSCLPENLVSDEEIKALIIRTLPNEEDKKRKNYTGTNPCYILPEVIVRLNKTKIEHLLVDLPSIDKEKDDGTLGSHKEYWNTEGDNIQKHKTITEMVYIDNKVEDGIYFLNLQIISVESDASPSRPVLYRIKQM